MSRGVMEELAHAVGIVAALIERHVKGDVIRVVVEIDLIGITAGSRGA